MNYIISQYLVFEKNDQGGILPETRWDRRTRLYNEGRAEAVSNWNRYQEDEKVLTNLNKKLQENGQTITDNAERQKIADKVLKNASERAKDYGNQIVANTKTLSDFKKENEVENPNKQVKPKFTDGLKSFASSALSSIGNAVISAGTAMIAQQLISWGLQGIDAIVHYDDNIIAKGQEAKESIQSQTKAYEDQKASLGELTSKYTELSKGVKISGNSIKNISLTDDEYKDFLDTSNQIAAAAPSLTRSWDSQGNAILNAGTNAEDLNTQVNDYLKLQRNLTYYDTKKNISDQYKGYETALGKNKGKQDEYKNAYDAAKYKVDSVQKFSDMLKKHTKGEDTITYTLDQTAYDALGNTFGKAASLGLSGVAITDHESVSGHEGTVRSIMENDKEIEFKFHARKLEYIASFLKPATAGSDISPFSTKNLPKCDYPIPEEDLAEYNAILDSMDNKDYLLVSRITDTFLTNKLQKSKQYRTIDLKKDMKKKCLKTKEYIHSLGEWDKYIKYLKENIK